MDAIFGGLGFIAGLAAAVYGYALLPSLALAIFALAAVSYPVGSALPDAIADERRVRPTPPSAHGRRRGRLGELPLVAGGVTRALLGRALFPRARGGEETTE